MKSLKLLFFTFSALSMIGCSSTAVESDASTDEHSSSNVSTEVSTKDESSASIDDKETDSSAGNEVAETESKESDSQAQKTEDTPAASSPETSGSPVASEGNVENGTSEGTAIDAVIEADEEIDSENLSVYQFLVTEDSENVYQVEVRADNDDGSISNLLGTYHYEGETGRVLKMNIETGEYEHIN